MLLWPSTFYIADAHSTGYCEHMTDGVNTAQRHLSVLCLHWRVDVCEFRFKILLTARFNYNVPTFRDCFQRIGTKARDW